ncbi:MAG: YlxR family protein [Chloroflexi bacterium]|nr:YlxR family protein [Chloroflexota bacterium]
MATNIKSQPQRTCVVCRQEDDKRKLVRFVRTPGGILLDESGRLNGRGAYVCCSTSCLSEAIKKQSLQRALKTEMTSGTLDKILKLGERIVRTENGGK